MTKNQFCEGKALTNESDVEHFFVDRLLKFLDYQDNQIKTKTSLSELVISRGSRKENYKPDYVLFHGKKPKIIIDAKSPTERIDDFTYQVAGYALNLNKKFKGENPVRYTILVNGPKFKLYNWDEEEPILELVFGDFVSGNKKFIKLQELINPKRIGVDTGENDILISSFLSKPTVEEVKSSFNKCHNLIWKKEKISPTDAFYEFSKIIFVKLNEDKRIRKLIEKGQPLKRTDFKFSIEWLAERESETENPMSSILFKELQRILQEEIEKNHKKPIFSNDEGIELKTETITEVVKVLQNYDLYTIDEDLNGRMFETFLNATIRGRELGQYFTPRKIVKFMTKLADLKVGRHGGNIQVDSVLDACCGSGGFLIDAMTDLTEKVKANSSLAPYKEEVLTHIRTKSIFGIEANSKISKIARMNMYVHGDGGSRIYCADSLDKEIEIKRGTNRVIKKELEELKEIIQTQGKKFDVVLTNPPFSMAYSAKEEDERTILTQYGSEDAQKNLTFENGTSRLKSSVKSNILFVARYFEFLSGGGKLLIVLDNSILNSYTHKDYRNFIRSHFLIKAIIQLPTHTFVNQEAGGITSILFLEKRISSSQEQPPIFARVVENIGHSESGKELALDDFNDIFKEYSRYEQDGKLFLKGQNEIQDFENDLLFLIDPKNINDRLDVFFHQPSFWKLKAEITESEKKGNCLIKKISDFEKVIGIDEAQFETDENQIFKYVEISSLDKERGRIMEEEYEEGTRKQLPNRAKLLLKENDVLFSKPFRSLQKVAIVPRWLNNQLGSSGFVGIRPPNYKTACLIWALFRSELIQKQLIHLSSGYTQRELNDEYLDLLLIPIPTNDSELAESVVQNIEKALQSRKKELEALKEIIDAPKRQVLGG